MIKDLLKMQLTEKFGYFCDVQQFKIITRTMTDKIIPAIKKNTFESVLMRQMKLQPIIQSEVSQEEKHQYNILTHIHGIQKDGNNNSICETDSKRDTDVQNSLLDSVGEGEGGMI